MRDLAKFRSSEMSDDAVAVAYLVANSDWDRLSQRLIAMRDRVDTLAGYVSQLLMVTAAGDAPDGESLDKKKARAENAGLT